VGPDRDVHSIGANLRNACNALFEVDEGFDAFSATVLAMYFVI